MQGRNLEAVCLAASSLPEVTVHRPVEYSSSFLNPDITPVLAPSPLPKDYRQHSAWISYTESLKQKVGEYSRKAKVLCIVSVLLFYAAVTLLPFGLMIYAENPLAAHLMYVVYAGISACLEGYMCYYFRMTDTEMDELESDTHTKLQALYPKLRVQEDMKLQPTPLAQIAVALAWGQASRLDTYLHMCFVAILSADNSHSVLWGLSLGLILLFLVFYNWTLCVLQSEGRKGLSVSRLTRDMSGYLEYCGLYLLSSQYCENLVLDEQSLKLVEEIQHNSVSPVVFRYMKWIVEDAAQFILIVMYLHEDGTNPLIAYSAAMSLLMLLSGLALLSCRKKLQVLLW